MTYSTLISADALAAGLRSATPPVVLDCSSELSDAGAGLRQYRAGHVPGARHVSLNPGLSGPSTGRNGRNPLPDPTAFCGSMAALGVGDDTQVVACDCSGGLYAARLWWLLRWIGHARVAVLDGGLPGWRAAGHPVTRELPDPPRAARLNPRVALARVASYDAVRANVDAPRRLVIDARAADRFRGENESMEAQAGHIPGARNRPFRDNLQADGRFKPASSLREEFDAITGGRPGPAVVHSCGSGVSACHNLLAMELAGLQGAALYPGSWSEWSVQPGAPIATGDA